MEDQPIKLTEAETERFLEALKSPPPPNEALVKAMRKYWEQEDTRGRNQ
ncbi:hypothetical protein H1O16_gp199 [Burkholderia phage BcepSaruman]|uniref:DUF1778 domain-containing protein n=1 Tax=Burkholderia phage BcepSaruman TaxID=2530032 RepID=A0A4D5ZGI3_9CAUD|nr:hypothetical protein H1O16_gp199 [Burkholderia phage BcepSaruman]QBX06612.1 hypothetical protein BcepSaruman_199 [Burkholderia phage BcepSaruman]